MKKLLVLILFFLIVVSKSNGQINLVPNYSFEAMDTFCNSGSIDGTPPWLSPSGGSPECFKTCAILQPNYLVPQNIWGFQWSLTGIGYAGFGVYVNQPPWSNYREYIQVKLIDSLVITKKYAVSFFVSLMDSSNYGTDDIGAYFSDTAIFKNISDYSPFTIYTPQITNLQGNFLTDKENWIKISGIYISHGGEQYLTIGNFYDDANTDTIIVSGGSLSQMKESGYYIDDVSVTLIPDTIEPVPPENDIFIPNIFSPNNDLNNDVLYVRSHNIREMTFSIFNRWGEKVFESKEITKGWDGTYKGLACNEGVFFYYLDATLQDGTIVQKKGNVTLIR
jgi:gliding motility-associated-like protein